MQSDAFRQAVERHDSAGLDAVLAPDVVLRSPAVFRPYEGRDAVLMLLHAVSHVFERFRYTDRSETGDTASLAFSASVGGRSRDGIDICASTARAACASSASTCGRSAA